MTSGSASRTGEVVALIRAGLERPHSAEGDPGAQGSLVAGMRPPLATDLRPRIQVRTTFFDDAVQRAISAGIRQVVIAGAGYDDRALRFRTTGVRFFELDHPGTQGLKSQRLRGLDTSGLTLVPADFATDDVAGVLAAAGQHDTEPTLFICEGLLVYLEQHVITALLRSLAGRAAPGSVLAASLAIHADGMDSRRVAEIANARRRAGRSEPWLTILPRHEHLDLLERAGWRVAEVSAPPVMEPGLLITARLAGSEPEPAPEPAAEAKAQDAADELPRQR